MMALAAVARPMVVNTVVWENMRDRPIAGHTAIAWVSNPPAIPSAATRAITITGGQPNCTPKMKASKVPIITRLPWAKLKTPLAASTKVRLVAIST